MLPFVLVVGLMFEPREYSLSPLRGVLAQARPAEMNTLAVVLPKHAFQGIAVRPL
jgi:hypothetical protein